MRVDISQEEHKAILDAGLTLDGVLVLKQIAGYVPVDVRMNGVAGLLARKGYTDVMGITVKGAELLNSLFVTEVAPPEPVKVDVMNSFAGELHAALQLRLLELTGKTQKKLQDRYAFLCNKIDLEKKLRDVWKKHGKFDHDAVKKLLIHYVNRCHRANWDKVQLIQYYIMKEGISNMWTDLEMAEDQTEQIEVKKVAVDPKTLF